MPTVISDVHMQNIWGYVNHEIKFLEEEEAQKLCISQSMNFDLPTMGLAVQIPPESMDWPPEGFVNVLYGPNGAGKSTILKIMNDSFKLVDGLVNQYVHQQSTYLKRESAFQWIEGNLPSNVSVPGEQGRLKTINFEHNSFVRALMQNFRSPTKQRNVNQARAINDNLPWDDWQFHSKNKKPISLEIKGIHCHEGVDYRFKLFFEALDLGQYEFGPEALHTPGRISNLGDAGFVVKCDLEKMESTYNLELNESPDGPLMGMYDPVEMDDERFLGYVVDEQYNSCIPFVIAENFDVIVLGQLVLPLHQMDEMDEDKVWSPISTFAFEGSSKNISEPNPNESELYLREWASEYWFLNPKSTNPEMEYYFEDGKEYVHTGLPSSGDLLSRIEAIKNISQNLHGDYAFLGGMSILEQKPKVNHRRIPIPSDKINNIGQYNAIMQLITHRGAIAMAYAIDFRSIVDQIKSDDDHLFKCSFLQDIPGESEEFRTLMKSYTGRRGYLDRHYGFSKFDASIPNDEILRVDYIRNRLEFLFSEGLTQLHHIRKNSEMKDLWQTLTQYQMIEESTYFSKSGIERTGDKKRVNFDVLSSGERSLFNLISLLASTEKTGPIYVDEPELSLHPAWQLKIKELVLKIIQYTRRQVFFASHSPDIVIPLTDRAFAIEHNEGNE
jgi:ABC-type cobalamin/Fe3+-siderophores transport system ATPase subunit